MPPIVIPAITTLPDPPTKTDPANFAVRADAFLSALEVFSSELTTAITEMNKLVTGLNGTDSAEAYNPATPYNFPTMVACTDGFTYRCVGTNITGVNPVTDDGTNWVRQVAPSILEVVSEVDLTGTGAASLNGVDYDVFLVQNFNQSTTLTISMSIGRTLTIALVNPGANNVAYTISGVTIYWMNGEIVDPEPVGITLVTLTRLSSTIAVASYTTGHLSV
jgi:hypothetical protein